MSESFFCRPSEKYGFIACTKGIIPYFQVKCETGRYPSYPILANNSYVAVTRGITTYITELEYKERLRGFISKRPPDYVVREVGKFLRGLLERQEEVKDELESYRVFREAYKRLISSPFVVGKEFKGFKSPSLFFSNSLTIIPEPSKEMRRNAMIFTSEELPLKEVTKRIKVNNEEQEFTAYVPPSALKGLFNNPYAELSLFVQTVGMPENEAREFFLKHFTGYAYLEHTVGVSRLLEDVEKALMRQLLRKNKRR